jgi:hypothetical protein
MGCTTWVHSPRNFIFALLVLVLMSPQNSLMASAAASGKDPLFDTGTIMSVVDGISYIALLQSHLSDLHSGNAKIIVTNMQMLHILLCTLCDMHISHDFTHLISENAEKCRSAV